MTNFRKSSASPILLDTYTVAEAAGLLHKSEDTITRWCKSGKLLSQPKRYGKKWSYLIPREAIEFWLQKEAIKRQLSHGKSASVSELHSQVVSHASLIGRFQQVLILASNGGKPYSPYTVRYYADHLKTFFQHYDEMTYENVRSRLDAIDAKQFATREKLHRACVCFAKYLVKEGLAEEALVKDLKTLKPRRPDDNIKRLTIDVDGLDKMIEGCYKWDKDANKIAVIENLLIIMLLAYTGLRAGEYGDLRRRDIDLKKQTLIVRKGKGGKSRIVGLTQDLIRIIERYLETHPKSLDDWFHMNDLGQKMTKDGVYQRVRRIGDSVGVPAASHALRRAFVTINANSGKPLHMLQKACGHADIKTTMVYCRTSDQELIDAMKAW